MIDIKYHLLYTVLCVLLQLMMAFMQINCTRYRKCSLVLEVEHMALRSSNPTMTRQLMEGWSKLVTSPDSCRAASKILCGMTLRLSGDINACFLPFPQSQSTKRRSKNLLNSCLETGKLKDTEENAVVRCPIQMRGYQPSGLHIASNGSVSIWTSLRGSDIETWWYFDPGRLTSEIESTSFYESDSIVFPSLPPKVES